jgi:hypothetical protein
MPLNAMSGGISASMKGTLEPGHTGEPSVTYGQQSLGPSFKHTAQYMDNGKLNILIEY